MIPEHLYKYRPFNANTLRLLSQAESYYADPSNFNDPLDCKPVISVDTDLPTLENVCHRVVELSVNEEAARKTIDHLRYESRQYETQDESDAYYRQRLADTTKDFLFTDFERCGVLSLAARWNCPLMWSHYADKHRGLCIEYDLKDHRCANLHAVDYSTALLKPNKPYGKRFSTRRPRNGSTNRNGATYTVHREACDAIQQSSPVW